MLVDKLLKTEVIQCADVANWVFSKEMSREFTKSYVWEILHLTIRLYIIMLLELEKMPIASIWKSFGPFLFDRFLQKDEHARGILDQRCPNSPKAIGRHRF